MTAQPLRIDERNHVEKPLLDQLAGLGWEIFDLDHKQRPADSFRESFAEVVMLPVLRERLKVINPWLEEDQVEEAVRRLSVSRVRGCWKTTGTSSTCCFPTPASAGTARLVKGARPSVTGTRCASRSRTA